LSTAGSGAPFAAPVAITFANAAEIRAAGEAFVEQGAGSLQISLGALEESNSIAVATMLAWYRRARRLEKSLVFIDIPDDLRNIIELYGLTEVLGLEPAADVRLVSETP
jgi:phospholipid transport system transporter-binding protein